MSKLSDQVREFMAAFGQHCADKPCIPPHDVVRLRARLVIEEAFELVDSLFDDEPSVKALKAAALHLASTAMVDVDLVEFADACGDLDYVTEGARIAFGVDVDPIADEIHRSNMAKVGGYLDEHGKLRKPAGWQPPDIHGCINAQRLKS